MPRSVLFVDREPTRTGAPMVLRNLLRWLRSQTDWSLTLLLPTGGELLEDFAAVATTIVVDRLARPQGTAAQISIPMPTQPDVIYYNTVASALTPPAGVPSICHVHELEFALRAWGGPNPPTTFFGRFDRFIACAEAVRQNLVENHRIPSGRIDVVHEFIDTSAAGEWVNRPDAMTWLRQKLGLGADTKIVGCAGTIEWRKGSDLFVQLARTMMRRRTDLPVHFVWLGGNPASLDSYKFRHDIRLAGLEKCITVISAQPDPLRYLAAFDIFVLPSREDPFPLVCLESAACGKPVVCFDSAGGMPEFVESDCGRVVPYLDIEAMSDAVYRLLDAPAERSAVGRVAREKVRQRSDISVAGPKIAQLIENSIAGATRESGPPR